MSRNGEQGSNTNGDHLYLKQNLRVESNRKTSSHIITTGRVGTGALLHQTRRELALEINMPEERGLEWKTELDWTGDGTNLLPKV